MSGPVLIVAASRDRRAIGHGLFGALAASVVSVGLLVHRLGDAAAPPQLMGAGNTLVMPAAANGQCHVDLWIGDALLPGALTDSGADGFVTIGRNQAKQAGIEISRLRFDRTYESAHGRGRYAVTRVPWVRIGNAFDMRDVPVDVTEVDQAQALIGIQILRYFNYRLRAGRCELSWWPT
jgi:clan AA aspartic protease (TIGR02281 family)